MYCSLQADRPHWRCQQSRKWCGFFTGGALDCTHVLSGPLRHLPLAPHPPCTEVVTTLHCLALFVSRSRGGSGCTTVEKVPPARCRSWPGGLQSAAPAAAAQRAHPRPASVCQPPCCWGLPLSGPWTCFRASEFAKSDSRWLSALSCSHPENSCQRCPA